MPGVPCMQHPVSSGGLREPWLPIFSTFRTRLGDSGRRFGPIWLPMGAENTCKIAPKIDAKTDGETNQKKHEKVV